jgi:hypothetical protein
MQRSPCEEVLIGCRPTDTLSRRYAQEGTVAMHPISYAQWPAVVKIGRRVGYVSLCSHAGLRSAASVELEEEFLNLLAACIGETLVLAYNLEPAFFQDP